MKRVILKQRSDRPHWVGDGFPVRSIFTYNESAEMLSPFLLMDYAGPAHFAPTTKKLGVGEHPHRGFETVTIVYSGQVEHRDSSGGGGVIQAGDVQWMTAASGLVHEEFHGQDFAQSGGVFEMVQLWVNLPKKFKMAQPRYQGISSRDIPTISLKDDAGSLRLIAGEYNGVKGPAKTFSAINLWDLRLKVHSSSTLNLPIGHTGLIFVLKGQVKVSDQDILNPAELGVLDRSGTTVKIETLDQDSIVLFLGGEPFDEPVVGYGPFVMNTPAEIQQAFMDYQMGKMGTLSKIEGTDQ